MNWLARWLPLRRRLSGAQRAALRAYREMPSPVLDAPLHAMRYIVLDVETSGLNPFRDHLISVGAVALSNGLICLEHSFEVENYARHDAVADAFATVQLFQIALAQAAQQELRCCADLMRFEKAQRWLKKVAKRST